MEIGGLTANFHVRTPWELRSLEPAGDFGKERHILELLASTVRPGDVVYDIGSNFGFYTVLLAKAVGPNGVVIAVEPESQSYDHLQENLKLNALTNVRSFRLGLGDQSGEAKLFLGEVAGASSLGQSSETAHSYKWVQVVEGDHLVEEKSLPVPRVVKIDVEGHEWAVIRGLCQTLARPECELVCCEIHPQLLPASVQPQQVLDLLRLLGFNRIDVYERRTIEYHVLAYKQGFQAEGEA